MGVSDAEPALACRLLMRGSMKTLIVITTLVLAGCEISPVITDPADHGGGRFSDCRRAAREVCRHEPDSVDGNRKECEARATYECVSSGNSRAWRVTRKVVNTCV